jgi:hypothetical protein
VPFHDAPTYAMCEVASVKGKSLVFVTGVLLAEGEVVSEGWTVVSGGGQGVAGLGGIPVNTW